MTVAELREWGRAHRTFLNSITAALIIGTIVIWLVWDAFLGWAGAMTESRMLTNWSYLTISLPWAIGALCGHWWGYWRGKPSPYIAWRTWTFFSFFAAIIIWDLVNWQWGSPEFLHEVRYAGYWPIIGFPMGKYLWGQRGTGPKTDGK